MLRVETMTTDDEIIEKNLDSKEEIWIPSDSHLKRMRQMLSEARADQKKIDEAESLKPIFQLPLIQTELQKLAEALVISVDREQKIRVDERNLIRKLFSEQDFIERLADLEHRQWRHWRIAVENTNAIPNSPFTKLEYKDLDDSVKEDDRKWARKAQKIILLFLQTHAAGSEIESRTKETNGSRLARVSVDNPAYPLLPPDEKSSSIHRSSDEPAGLEEPEGRA